MPEPAAAPRPTSGQPTAVPVLRRVAALRQALAQERDQGRTVALVPTMGALHQGHGSLIRLAREHADVTVVSIFVNPTQFDDPADLAAYPRDEDADVRLAAQAGATLVFAPDTAEIHPARSVTQVTVGGLAEVLEGAIRGPAHFAGVATVVTKLLNIVAPDVAVFGQKDAQQLAVLRRVTEDLHMQVKLVAGPTMRDPDGLALSSRNRRLDPVWRERARGMPEALAAAQARLWEGEVSAATLEATARAVLEARGLSTDYAELVDPDLLTPVERVDGPVLLVLAARAGEVRLIDNAVLAPVDDGPSATPRGSTAQPTTVTEHPHES